MPSMTDDLGRMAHGIAASRRERMQAGAERQREAGSRHRAVGGRLHGIKTSREKMGREQRKDAAAGRRRRATESEVLLRQFHRSREAQHRHQLELAAAERVGAAAFMRDLTGRVAALRDNFGAGQRARAKSRHDSAQALHERLALYRQDRHDAGAAWRGMPARQMPPPDPFVAHRPVAEPHPARAEPPHPEPAGSEPAAFAAPPAESATRFGRHRATHATPGEDRGSS